MREQAQDRREGKGFYIRVFLLLEGLVLAFAGVFYVSCKETLYAGGAAGVQPGQLSAGQPYGEPGTWTGRHYGWLVLAAAAAAAVMYAAEVWRRKKGKYSFFFRDGGCIEKIQLPDPPAGRAGF